MEEVLNINVDSTNDEMNQADKPITPSDIRDVHFT